MQIYVLRNGERLGPYSREQVEELLEGGIFVLMDLAWAGQTDEWQPLYKLVGTARRHIAVPESLAGNVNSGAESFVHTPVTQMGSGVNEEDIALFVGRNSAHFVKAWKIRQLPYRQNWWKRGSGLGCALFGYFWFIYRKMYLLALLVWLLSIAWVTLAERQHWGNPSAGRVFSMILVLLAGDGFYLWRAEKRIRRIKQQEKNPQLQRAMIVRAGGTSATAVVLAAALLVVCISAPGFYNELIQTNVARPNASPVTEPVAAPVAHSEPAKASVPPARVLAPDGTFFLLTYKSVMHTKGVMGFGPGTQVQRVKDEGDTLLVQSQGLQFEVRKDALTNDLVLGQSLATADFNEQYKLGTRAIAADIAASNAKAAEKLRNELIRQQHLNANSGMDYPYVSPLERKAYDQTPMR